jgi:hypothetical protein
MCANTFKQIYSMLKPILDSGDGGIPIKEYPQLVAQTSLSRFARDYSDAPESLSAVVKRAIRDGEIEILSGARLKLTERGQRSYWYVYNKEITDVPQPKKREVRTGTAASQKYRSERRQMALGGA